MRKLILGILVSAAMVASLTDSVSAQTGPRPRATPADHTRHPAPRTRHAAPRTRHASPHPAHATSSRPTLGVASSHATGFGKVKPKLVSYDGDGQSFVANVRWNSWGGGRAIGHGVASWVWPGWCAACGSVNLRATVVAFGRSSCRGRPIYKYVEWYFPSRGMRFSPGLAVANLCSWSFSSGGLFSPRRCRAIDLPGSPSTPRGVAQKIMIYESRVSCASVRGFLRGSGVMRHYGRNARFHRHGWWCGSELSMQLHRLPPQDFACVRGDYENVSFNVRRR